MSARCRDRLTVIGIHTPELPFERSLGNVERAVREHGLTYPIGLDNDYSAWEAFGNRYWPSLYLVDGASEIRYTQIGEGQYRRVRGGDPPAPGRRCVDVQRLTRQVLAH